MYVCYLASYVYTPTGLDQDGDGTVARKQTNSYFGFFHGLFDQTGS
jgi:hypothetical protein